MIQMCSQFQISGAKSPFKNSTYKPFVEMRSLVLKQYFRVLVCLCNKIFAKLFVTLY